MKRVYVLLLVFGLITTLVVSGQNVASSEKTRGLIITGGHGFEREPFLKFSATTR